jgi:hypothetical protein
MEHLPPDGIRCDRCSTGFKDVEELARHNQTHETGSVEDIVARPDGLHAGNGTPRQGLKDILGPVPSIRLDGSEEDARSERDLTEAQRNDRANAEANRAVADDDREDSEFEVNPDQTPEGAKTIRPMDSV